MASPLFSIVLPTYNRAYVLWRAIQGVINQDEESWELIVVDDGSTDGTLKLVQEFRDVRVRVVSTSNCGPSAARNRGIADARGRFVAYLDSDNWMYPNFLSVFREHIDTCPTAVMWYCGQHNKIWERAANGEWSLFAENDNLRAQYKIEEVMGFNGPDTGAMVHKRDMIASIGGWDEDCNWLEDWDFFARTNLVYPGGAIWIPNVLYEYRQVHGEAPDGICAEARENVEMERRGRRYLLDKWQGQLTAKGIEKLDRDICELDRIRA